MKGVVDVENVMAGLAARRPVFHSEADFQHELAWEVRSQSANVQVRLEQPFPGRGRGAIDLIAYRDGAAHAVELKYLTTLHQCASDGEDFQLKKQSAQDIRRYDVCRDIERMEAFCSVPNRTASVIVLTNDPYYWMGRTRAGTCAEAFDISGRRELSGELRWAAHTGGTKKGREAPITLGFRYLPEWKEYSNLGGGKGHFRFMHLRVSGSER